MILDQQPKGLYLHIPFCRHLCGYCAFAKTDQGAFSESLQSQYIEALKLEFDLRREFFDPQEIKTLYIGGGTPSRLAEKPLDDLLRFLDRELNLNQLQELTFEINPEDLNERPEILTQIVDYGINRVSIGIQTFQEQGIRVLERKTNAQQNIQALRTLTKNFNGRISMDIILAWPNQNLADLENDLTILEDFSIGHYSTYLLNYEPGTRLERDRKKGRIQVLDEDIAADLWERFQAFCHDHSYKHYEISSFCKSSQQSQHNISTWRGEPYLGLGSGAVSRIKDQRWTNQKVITQYMESCSQQTFPIQESETITPNMHWEEDLLLALRHDEGLDLKQFKQQHGIDLSQLLKSELEQGLQQGYWHHDSSHLAFKAKAWQLFDHFLSDWMIKIDESVQKLQS